SGGGNITITDPSMEDLHLTIQALDNDVTLFAQNINVISGSLSYSSDGMLMLLANQQAEITCGYELELMNGGTPVNIQPMNSNTLTYTAANTINITPLFNFNKKQRTIGNKVYEKSNHLGNVLVTLSDRKFPINTGSSWDYYKPNVKSYSDYYPFGSLLPNRHTTQTSSDYDQNNNRVYRYGFNGMERDFEVKNVTGAHYDFGARVYDSRLGRFFTTDPREKEFSYQTPYAFAENNPMYFIDNNGEAAVQPSAKNIALTGAAILKNSSFVLRAATVSMNFRVHNFWQLAHGHSGHFGWSGALGVVGEGVAASVLYKNFLRFPMQGTGRINGTFNNNIFSASGTWDYKVVITGQKEKGNKNVLHDFTFSGYS